MKPGENNLLKQHLQFYKGQRKIQNEGRINTPGSQYVIQLLKSGYLGEEYSHGANKTALDVGCGSGFNCVSLERLGYNVKGCEIDVNIAALARKNISAYGCRAIIDIGRNEDLPYENASFDLLISLNSIHYVSSLERIEKTVSEYSRVLKPGGMLFLSTNHPENWILQGAAPISDNVFRVQIKKDYRHNLDFYVFPNRTELAGCFSSHFDNIKTGENKLDFFDKKVRNFILKGTRPL